MTLINLLIFSAGFLHAQDEPKTEWMREVNTIYDEYSPAIYQDGILLITNRKSSALTAYEGPDGKFTSDIYFAKQNDERLKPAKILEAGINTKLNEGPTCFSADYKTMYFTQNIKAKKMGQQDRLGIFVSKYEDGFWSKKRTFAYNCQNDEYSVAHPALTHDGKTLVFTSDMEGNDNGKDLFICFKDEYNNWSEPKNLGKKINSDKNEVFPSFDKEGNLYFASDGYSRNKGLDILFAERLSDGTWDKPKLLPEPINSEKDDFGLTTITGSEGYFTSNRKRGNDDIFKFYLPIDKTPEFTGCKPNSKQYLCYLIEDENLQVSNDNNYRFDWKFDDGTTKHGISIKNCFPEPGQYYIKLDITDTITHEIYKGVSDVLVVIEKVDRPFIVSDDTAKKFETIQFSVVQQEKVPFKITEYYWMVDGKKTVNEENTTFVFEEPGTYRITLGVIGNPDKSKEKRCVYKDIIIE